MKLHTITLQNFRNYIDQTVSFGDTVNVLCGENAQGKTNLLEAVYALSIMKLFRTGQKKEGLRFSADAGRIYASFEAEKRDFTLEMKLYRHKSMEVYRNDVRMKRQSDAAGILQSVLFCPDDLYLIRAGAAARRRFLDDALCQLRPQYALCLAEYNRLLAHKLRILRDSEEKPSLLELLDDFSVKMAQYGARIIRYRAYYIRSLAEKAQDIHQKIAPQERLCTLYHTVSTIEDPFAPAQEVERALLRHMQTHRAAEIAARSCLSGPHKDDLLLTINDVSAASFGSQGQVRTCALALKLAEREMFYEDSGEYPLLLLDDVLSELDHKRQDFVLNQIIGGQVLITCCEDDISGRMQAGRVFTIQNGEIT